MRGFGISAAVLALSLWGCGNDPKPAVQPAPTPVQAEPAPAEPAPAEPAPVEPEPAEPDDSCQAECVQRNQMRAVAPEQIESDCAAECAAASDPQ